MTILSPRLLYPSFIALLVSILAYFFVFSNTSPTTNTTSTQYQSSASTSTVTNTETSTSTLLSSSLNKRKEMSATVTATNIAAKNITSRLRPVYFVSHGGPTFMYRDDDFGDAGAWDTVTAIGKEVLADPPKAMVVISAHWQEESSGSGKNSLPTVGITSTDNENSLIYDFYGFPSHMYKEQFHTKGSKSISRKIAELLQKPRVSDDGTNFPGFNVKLHGSRGFDHGLWVPLRVAFPDQSIKNQKNDVPFPVIQVSLPSTPSGMRSHAPASVDYDTDTSFRLGEALRELRDREGEDIAIVCSGMSVHNLRDLFSMGGATAPYASKFEKQLKQVVEVGPNDEMLTRMKKLFKEPITRSAHPTLEHLLPIAVAAGTNAAFLPEGATFDSSLTKIPSSPVAAADLKKIIGPIDFKPKQLYTNASYSLAWGIYKFGRI